MMKKRFARLVGLLLAAAMICSLAAGCDSSAPTDSSSPSTSEGSSQPAGDTKGKIGYNYLVMGDFALDTLANNTKRAIEAAGYEAMGVCANGAVDQTNTDI